MDIQKLFSSCCVFVLVVISAQAGIGQEFEPAIATPFEIPSIAGGTVSLTSTETAEFTVVCFLGVECPLAKLYAPRLAELSDKFSGRVNFLGINSNRQDSPEEFSEFVSRIRIAFPCGKDHENVVADQLNVKRTPEVVVVDRKLKIKYRGRIDDQYAPGIARNKPDREDLKIALEELLAGNTVTLPQTESAGCLLGRKLKLTENATVTYSNQVSRVLQRHCVECHRTGEIGPFPLDNYEDAVGWADMIVETIDNGRMPPWHADPKYGHFRNERRMSKSDKQLLRQWVADGAPLGNASELPANKTFVNGWQLPREPDLIVHMRDRPFNIPAEGTVEYQYFVVDPDFTEDKWVSAAQVIPGNASVVHHSIVFIRPPDGGEVSGVGWLCAYVPGQRNLEFDPHRARRIPAGSKLVFQQHYTPNGTCQADTTKIGMIFAAAEDVQEELLTLMAIDQQFEIAPQESNHTVDAMLPWIPESGKLLSIGPHMHYRGKSFVAELKTSQQTEVLLSVPHYDFNWQHIYQLSNPISLSDVEQLKISVTFDNSAANPFNPDPTQFVTWGDQTWEEMAVGFFDVAVPRDKPTRPESTETNVEATLSTAANVEREQKIEQFVNSFFDRFDANGDGLVVLNELPLSMGVWAYSSFDTDGADGLSRVEIRKQAELRF